MYNRINNQNLNENINDILNAYCFVKNNLINYTTK